MTKVNILVFVIVIALAGITGFAYNQNRQLDFSSWVRSAKDSVTKAKGINVSFSLEANVQDDTVSVKYNVPCSSMEQKSDILKNLPIIKNGIMLAINQPKMMMAVEQRDFRFIKKRSLEIINEYAVIDVDKIYIDYFSLQGFN